MSFNINVSKPIIATVKSGVYSDTVRQFVIYQSI